MIDLGIAPERRQMLLTETAMTQWRAGGVNAHEPDPAQRFSVK